MKTFLAHLTTGMLTLAAAMYSNQQWNDALRGNQAALSERLAGIELQCRMMQHEISELDRADERQRDWMHAMERSK